MTIKTTNSTSPNPVGEVAAARDPHFNFSGAFGIEAVGGACEKTRDMAVRDIFKDLTQMSAITTARNVAVQYGLPVAAAMAVDPSGVLPLVYLAGRELKKITDGVRSV